MSHSACKPVRDSVLGQTLNTINDIYRINAHVHANSLDLLQAPHTLSGIDIALWDIMGKMLGEPVYKLLGYARAHPKVPYASQLFGDTPQATYEKALAVRKNGFRAAKFGWGPYGLGSVDVDAAHVYAAREGLGLDGILLIDAGTVWYDDVQKGEARLAALNECRVAWLEEPFVSGALKSYAALAARAGAVKMAGGEGCHTFHMAQHMIDYANLGYVQIDTGRIGGISTAHQVAQYANAHNVTYVNHTFTSNLALSASLQPYAGLASDEICEYPVELKQLAYDMTLEHIVPDRNGYIHVPEGPGLGITPNIAGIQPYIVPCEIRVYDKVIYTTPPLTS